MKIQQLDLTIRDLVAGYHDDGDDGVVGCARHPIAFGRGTADMNDTVDSTDQQDESFQWIGYSRSSVLSYDGDRRVRGQLK